MPKLKLTKRAIDALAPDKASDRIYSEFGDRRLRSTRDPEGRPHLRSQISRRQPTAMVQDRKTRRALDARFRPKRGVAPVGRGSGRARPIKSSRAMGRTAPTFAEVGELYFARGIAHKKASTLRSDRSRWRLHLLPLLGAKRVDAITRGDVESAQCGQGGPHGRRVVSRGAARASPLSASRSRPASWSLRVAPAPTIRRAGSRSQSRARCSAFFPTVSSAVLRNRWTRRSSGRTRCTRWRQFDCSRYGCRRGEITELRWSEVDFERRLLNLPDSKTGKNDLSQRRRGGVASSHSLFPGQPLRHRGQRAKAEQRSRQDLGARPRARRLPDVRLHDLRHTYASVGAGSSFGLPIIGKLLGHTQASTTARYSHLADDPIRAAAEHIGASIATAMGSPKSRC